MEGGGKMATWLAKLKMKLKILLAIYLFLLAFCILLAAIFYFIRPDVSLSSETLTTNGVYLLEKSFHQELEDVILGDIEETFTMIRENVLMNNTFRAIAVLIAVLATVLMGFSMMIGDQKLTLKEFMMDVLIIFGTIGMLLSVNPDQYIKLLYNFLQSISSFISKMLFATTSDFMKIEYKDGTEVGPYAPLDVVVSIFFDDTISYRVRYKIIALTLSPALLFVPLVLIVLTYCLIPCTLNVFMAILFAKVGIMFALQFLPFFILFSAVNDVKIKVSKKAKGENFTWKLINQGIMQPLMFLALISFLAGLLYYIFVIQYIDNMFDFAVSNHRPDVPWPSPDCDCSWWNVGCWVLCGLKYLAKLAVRLILELLIFDVMNPVGLDYTTFFASPLFLWIGIVIFKKLFAEITPVIIGLTHGIGGSSLASDKFSQGGGVFSEKNDAAKMADLAFQKPADAVLKEGFGYDANDKLFDTEKLEFDTTEGKSDSSKGAVQKAGSAVMSKLFGG